jgi:hypothetical protein
VKLWRDGSRAAIGNARSQAVWVVDLQGAAASVELSGELAYGPTLCVLLPLWTCIWRYAVSACGCAILDSKVAYAYTWHVLSRSVRCTYWSGLLLDGRDSTVVQQHPVLGCQVIWHMELRSASLWLCKHGEQRCVCIHMACPLPVCAVHIVGLVCC